MDTLENTFVCENCQTPHEPVQKFCSQCSYPVGGTDDEKRTFRFAISKDKQALKEAQKKIKSAKNIIYFLAGLFIVIGLVSGFVLDDFPSLISNVVLCLVFLILAAWCERNPFGAILTAFILYVTVHIVNAFLDPTTLMQGLIIKIFFVIAFVKGIRSAHEAQTYFKSLVKVKAIPADSE